MRQRKLLLPAFHGDAVKQYVTMIREVAEREIDRWQTGTTFALAPRMQAVTLDVIMAGIFGVQGTAERGTLEYQLRETLRSFLRMSTRPIWAIVELQNLGQAEPRGLLRLILRRTDRLLYEVIRQRRAGGAGAERRDVLSLLLEARDEDGRPLSDAELRDELATLVLAGHETTANSLAWTFERLVRFPQAYERLRDVVRSDSKEESEAYVEATIYEGMRTRPVIPMVVRLVQRPWQLGSYVVPARTPVAISIIGVHHRDDVYPEPYAFRPERFLGSQQPGTYTWIPFGGGIRRCLGAALAMAEQKVVLSAIAGRTDLGAPNPAPERGRQRNVTMIPARGGEAVLRAKRSG
jgi:cytochrome P450